jgi:hypothetical protein
MSEKKSRFALDKNRLDDHWLEHTEQRSRSSRAKEQAELEYARAKSMVDLVKAELELEIRENPSKFGVKTLREQTVKALIIVQPRYQKAVRRMNRKKYNLGIHESDVVSYDHRKKALENLVVLWKGDYFARPRMSEDAEPEVKEAMRAKRARAAMKHGRLKRRKKDG